MKAIYIFVSEKNKSILRGVKNMKNLHKII